MYHQVVCRWNKRYPKKAANKKGALKKNKWHKSKTKIPHKTWKNCMDFNSVFVKSFQKFDFKRTLQDVRKRKTGRVAVTLGSQIKSF